MSDVPKTISFVVLYVKDIEASREFYEAKLGFPVKETDEGYVEFSTGGAPLALMSQEAASDLTGKSLDAASADAAPKFSLSLGEVSNVDEVYESLRASGVLFVNEPRTQPWGQRTAHLSDPDGNLWEIFTWVKED